MLGPAPPFSFFFPDPADFVFFGHGLIINQCTYHFKNYLESLPALQIDLHVSLYDRWRKLLFRFHRRRPLQNDNSSICFALQCRGINPEELAPPPQALRTLFFWRRKPVLPNDNAHLARRSMREGVACKEQ